MNELNLGKFKEQEAEAQERETHGGYDFAMDSLAVIANQQGTGTVLWYCGGHLTYEIREGCGNALEDLQLDDAPDGISVWEGRYNYVQTIDDDASSVEPEIQGRFREPEPEEWDAITENKCPWDREDWLLVNEDDMDTDCQECPWCETSMEQVCESPEEWECPECGAEMKAGRG